MSTAESVPTGAVLACLTRVVEERPSGGPLLVPVVLAERVRWTPLLRAAFEQDGSLVVDAAGCGAGVSAGDVHGDAPGLAEAVGALLDDYNAAVPGAALRLLVDAGTATVVGAVEYAKANQGQRTVRDIAAAVCHEDLRSADTAVLLVAEDALDAARVAAVWGLLMALPELLRMREDAKLVVFAGDGSAEPGGVHFAGPRSTRYVVSGRGLQVRRPWAHNRAAVAEIAPHGRQDMPLLVLFLGAGASTSAGLPLGNALRDTALEHLMQEAVTPDTFEEVAGRWHDRLGQLDRLGDGERLAGREAFVRSLTLERVLAVQQYQEGQTDCHTLRLFRRDHELVRERLAAQAAAGQLDDDPLVRLLRVQKRLVLVTVNFDQVVEAKGAGLVRPFVTDEDFAGLPAYLDAFSVSGGPVPLVKMHGDIDAPDSIVANLDQTQAGLSLARSQALGALVDRVRAQSVRPWWYVGYSMRDRDLESTWTGGAFADAVTERWVSPTVDPSVRAFVERQRLLRWSGAPRRGYSADERTITTTARDFFELLYDEVAARW